MGGFYFGGTIGGDITSNYNTDTERDTTFSFDNETGGLVPITLNNGTGGLIGGAELGYDYQYRGFVVGAEADIRAIQASGGGRFTSISTLLGSTFTTSSSEKLDYLATVRLRAGYAPFDRWLIYATGDVAFGGVNTSAKATMNSAPADVWSGPKYETRSGYVAGAGVEYA